MSINELIIDYNILVHDIHVKKCNMYILVIEYNVLHFLLKILGRKENGSYRVIFRK